MTTVYLVSSGSYSDYRVIGIYSTREGAEATSAIVDDANDIAEYELDEAIDAVRQGLKPWVVTFYEEHKPWPYQTDGYFHEAACGQVITSWEPSVYQSRDKATFQAYVFARGEAHALKIAQDKRAEYLAKEAGV